MSYALISERAHKATKRYRCIWCGESIPVSTRYVREFSVYDGDVQKHCWHPECKESAEAFFQEEGEDEFAPWENERPRSYAEQEYQSWDCALLSQGALSLGDPADRPCTCHNPPKPCAKRYALTECQARHDQTKEPTP